MKSSFQLRYRWPSPRFTLEPFELRLNKGSSLLEALIKTRLCTAFFNAQLILEPEELHNIYLFIGAERHDPGFGASVFIAAEPALVFSQPRRLCSHLIEAPASLGQRLCRLSGSRLEGSSGRVSLPEK